MKKIRRGNDFVFAWEIERNGLPEDLSSVLEKHLHLSVFDKRVELVEGVDYDITGNVIRIEVTPTIANILGTYKAEFNYILPDNGLIDEDRKCAVDVEAFIIVNSTAQADDPSEFTVTSDMAIAFKGDKGDKGDPLTYDDLTPEQKAELQQPATDAIASIQEVELAVETAEGLRVQAELNRQTNTSTAISNAEQATDDANDAAILANEKADLANDAAILANEKAGLAATATTEANTARDEANLAATAANTAAGLADTARLAIQSDLALKADEADLVQLAGDVSTKIIQTFQNGDFSSGAERWSATNGVFSVSDGVAQFTASAVNGYLRRSLGNSHTYAPHEKVYIAARVKATSNLVHLNLGGAGAAHSGSGSYEILSDIKIAGVDGLNDYFYYGRVRDGRASGWDAVYVDWMVNIPLSGVFGPGNEPTIGEMNALIGLVGYYDGTLVQNDLMRWQLKMIRQNRNAIIALGGTII